MTTKTPRPSPSRLVCAGCGFSPEPGEVAPFRCPRAGSDDVDHVLEKHLALRDVGSPGYWRKVFRRDEPNPFLRYRKLLHSYHDARAWGMSGAEWEDMVAELDERVKEVDGRGFRVTPLRDAPALAEAIGLADGIVLAKDETENVAGSHKARHLMGVLIRLVAARRTGRLAEDPRLAAFSCGNAALAAAVLARAVRWPLDVFVPTHASAPVLERLRSLGANIVPCPRREDTPGDPCRLRFRDSVAHGRALPFTCQGPENGLVIEGGETLAYEIVSALPADDVGPDRLFVQVGGGALASACVQGFRSAGEAGILPRRPRIHSVQTHGGFPLIRAWEHLLERFPALLQPEATDEAVAWAAGHRSSLMWPWEEEPRSIATGILDDETYDWLAVVRGMAETGGFPVRVEEKDLGDANALVRRTTGMACDATGSAGLAGALVMGRRGAMAPGERIVVLLTGVDRGAV